MKPLFYMYTFLYPFLCDSANSQTSSSKPEAVLVAAQKYLLDTSVVAGYLLARNRAMQVVRPLLAREAAATSMLVYGEVAEYVKKFAPFRAYKSSLEVLLERVFLYLLTYAILERYADIRGHCDHYIEILETLIPSAK